MLTHHQLLPLGFDDLVLLLFAQRYGEVFSLPQNVFSTVADERLAGN